MASAAPSLQPDKPVVLITTLGVLAVSLFLQHEFAIQQAFLFLIGIGLGISLYHAAFGFTGAWRGFIREGRGAGVRAQVLLFASTSVLFFPVLGGAFEGLSVSGAVAPAGVSVLVGAFLFGMGMQLGGGCGSGTLFTVGGGQVRMLITLAFFVVGSVLATAHMHWWSQLPNLGRISAVATWGWVPALAMQLAVLLALYLVIGAIERRRRGSVETAHTTTSPGGWLDRLVYGPWPLWWGALGLAVLNLLVLLVAGHPWSITFALGLWGAKLGVGLGLDVGSWPYWASGYPAQALGDSVLADATTLTDLGIIIGAALAAALAGRFAPATRLRANGVATAVAGGLLLGYGARLAFGCNIGAMLAGISSGSLHGWLWLAAGFAGNVVGVRLRSWSGLDSANRGAQ